MEGATPFDELIVRLNKCGNDPETKLIGSFLGEIRVIYLLMKEVSRSWLAILQSEKLQNPPGWLDLPIRTRLFYNLLVSTIVNYGDKNELIRKNIPNYYRIKMFRNTVSTHWKDYLDLPTYGSYYSASEEFSVPDYVKSNFQVPGVNAIFKKHDLNICLDDRSMLVENKFREFDKIYDVLEKKWGEKLRTLKKGKKTSLGIFLSELNSHLLIIPINDLGKFFVNLAERFNTLPVQPPRKTN